MFNSPFSATLDNLSTATYKSHVSQTHLQSFSIPNLNLNMASRFTLEFWKKEYQKIPEGLHIGSIQIFVRRFSFLRTWGRTCGVQKLFWMSKTLSAHNIFSPCSKLGIFMYWTCNSINNLLSYCGLVDAK